MHPRSSKVLAALLILTAASRPATAQCARPTLELLASDGAVEDYLGGAVAMHGNVVLAGAYGADVLGVETGAAYLFDVLTGAELGKLVRTDAGASDYFGWGVGLDGSSAVVGALGDGDLGHFAGAAYLFDTATGNQLMKLHASDGEFADRFGFSVAVHGNLVLVGAAYDDTNETDGGSAYLFNAQTGQELFHLKPSDKNNYERFGSAVAMDGGLAVIGAPGDNANGYNAGAAYLFDTATGTQLMKLIASDGETKDGFGDAVAIGANRVLVGAPAMIASANSVGAAYLFDATSGDELALLEPEDGEVYDAFGYSVGVSGNTVIVGAFGDDDQGGVSGSAYLFDASSGVQVAKLLAPDGAEGDYFGNVAIEGTTAVVGAAGDDALATDAGSLTVFDLGTTGSSYCQANPNSTSLSARISACGNTSLAANELMLAAQPVPDQFALFFHGQAAQQAPFGDGFLCAGGALTRLNPPAQASGHLALRTLDLALDGIQVPGTYYFQCWYRDPAAGGSGFNLSDGLEVTMVP